MAYKDLLVVLDTAPASSGRIELAATLAERSGAHLVGLYVTLSPHLAPGPGYFDPALFGPMFREIEQREREQADAARRAFEDAGTRHGISCEWRVASGDPSEAAAVNGRYADLAILGQLDPEDREARLSRPRPEEVALTIGRPVLVVPYAGQFENVGRRVLIGWDASREATRAVNDALPILTDAQSVTVLAIDAQEGPSGHGEIPGADIALHLSRHGVKAAIERTVSAGIGAGNILLSRASDLEADLLVMGAYAHSRVREILTGGATRTVLESMTLPVLMAH